MLISFYFLFFSVSFMFWYQLLLSSTMQLIINNLQLSEISYNDKASQVQFIASPTMHHALAEYGGVLPQQI